MAFINNFYIFVSDESISRSVEMSTHPVETGLDITDNVKRQPITLSISGEIVGDNASTVLSNIVALHQGGKIIKYSGRNIINNAMITKFDTGHPNTINGGCSFSAEISEIRIAKQAFRPVQLAKPKAPVTNKTTKSGTQQVQNNTAVKKHTVKKGDSLYSIAKAYYGNGNQYNKIYEANKDKIKNPNSISVGMVLTIP